MPRPHLLATEPLRAAADLAAGTAAMPLLLRAPRGDGHPVVVLPGFVASDESTRFLRTYLRALGYHVHGWRLGRNLGMDERTIAGLARRFAELEERHAQPMTIVGWSLGGVFARELARRRPSIVRQVITLGSPFGMFRPGAVGVPVTNVFTRSDGVVDWRTCLDRPGPRVENVEVTASHCGLGTNPGALWVVADRLSQPAGEWTPFVAPRHLRPVFPARRAAA